MDAITDAIIEKDANRFYSQMTKRNGTTERDEIEELLLALPLTFRRVMMMPNGLWRVDCCLPGIAEPVRQFHHVKLKAALGMAIRFADELEKGRAKTPAASGKM
jgi:hypothetical protein